MQVRIQDFEMGGEFYPPQSEKSEKSNIISIIWGIRKKKQKEAGSELKRGLRKMGGENSPISPSLDPRLFCSIRIKRSTESLSLVNAYANHGQNSDIPYLFD